MLTKKKVIFVINMQKFITSNIRHLQIKKINPNTTRHALIACVVCTNPVRLLKSGIINLKKKNPQLFALRLANVNAGQDKDFDLMRYENFTFGTCDGNLN